MGGTRFQHDDGSAFPDANKTYELRSLWDNYVLTGKDGSGNNERPTMVIDNDWTSQRWRFVSTGSGYYYIKNEWSGKYLVMKDEYENYNSPAFNVTADSFTGVASQKFKMTVDANGKYIIEGYYGVGLTSVEADNDSSRNFRRAAGRWPDPSKSSHRWIMSASQ